MKWYVICNKDGHFFTGERDQYSISLEFAKLFTENEKELSFVFQHETWYPLPNPGDS